MCGSLPTFEAFVGKSAGNPHIVGGKRFGKRCLDVDGKALVVLFGEVLAFKLADGPRAPALQIAGAHLFAPRGQGSAFKEWVQAPMRAPAEIVQLVERFEHNCDQYSEPAFTEAAVRHQLIDPFFNALRVQRV